MGKVKSFLSHERSENGKKAILALFWAINTVDSLYLEHPLSRTSLYLELKSQSLCVGCNLFFSLYLELSLSRSNSLVPWEFEIERVNCIPLWCVRIEYTNLLNRLSNQFMFIEWFVDLIHSKFQCFIILAYLIGPFSTGPNAALFS